MQPARTFDGSVPPPDFVSIETTKYCNLRCRMCFEYLDGTTVAGPLMQMEDFLRIGEALFPFVRRWQPSISGEATMTKGLQGMVALAERYGVKADMVSNATLLDPEKTRWLAPNVALMLFSFDGATAETFEEIRVGARFERVVDNIRRYVEHCRRELSEQDQPQIGLNCTLMERNVRELADIVRIAAELGLDFVHGYHMNPPDEANRPQSLVHHRELAIRCIDEAFARAEELGMPLSVTGLDRATCEAATGGALEGIPFDGHMVRGLGPRACLQERRRRLPLFDPDLPEHQVVRRRREESAAGRLFPPPRSDVGTQRSAALPDVLPWCNFLWSMTYVSIGGNVHPCCMPQAPKVGNYLEESFERIWNGEAYRTMRRRMVMGDPVDACRGCTHIQHARDPERIVALLGGHDLPRPQDEPPTPASLIPRLHAARATPPPSLSWPVQRDASSYVVEFSLDRASILFSTDSDESPRVHSNHYTVPGWAWRLSPADREIFYRVSAHIPGEKDRILLEGSFPPDRPA